MKTDIIALLQRHKGKANALTVEEITRRLHIKKIGFTNPHVRKAIKEIIKDSQIPIGSCAKGYFLIETENERLEVIDNLVKRQAGISTRIKALRNCRI